jgi:hypothetical protein
MRGSNLDVVVVLITALVWPFHGAVSVSPDALINTEQSWSDIRVFSSARAEVSVPSSRVGLPSLRAK